MALTESQRGYIVDRINSLDFTYQTLDPQVKVYRHREGFNRIHPTIMVEFMPSNRKRAQSVSNVIGKVPGGGDHYLYGYYHVELCSIHFYCQEKHETADKATIINGRTLIGHISEIVLDDILREWEEFLKQYYISFDWLDTVPAIKDLSLYDPVTETMIYNYDIDVYLRTRFVWDKVPEGYDENGDLADILSVEELKEINSNNISKIIIRYE